MQATIGEGKKKTQQSHEYLQLKAKSQFELIQAAHPKHLAWDSNIGIIREYTKEHGESGIWKSLPQLGLYILFHLSIQRYELFGSIRRRRLRCTNWIRRIQSHPESTYIKLHQFEVHMLNGSGPSGECTRILCCTAAHGLVAERNYPHMGAFYFFCPVRPNEREYAEYIFSTQASISVWLRRVRIYAYSGDALHAASAANGFNLGFAEIV